MITMIDTYNQQPTLYHHSNVYLELTTFKAELLTQVPSSVNATSIHSFLKTKTLACYLTPRSNPVSPPHKNNL